MNQNLQDIREDYTLQEMWHILKYVVLTAI